MGAAYRTRMLPLAFAATWAICPVASAQTYTGFQSCGGSECHTKNGEIEWLTKKPGGQEHRNSLGNMRSARQNSDKYAKAVGLSSFEDPKGMCVKCHATYIEKAKILEGVGCESCHGPASGYREFHSQNSKDYAGSVKRGMRDIKQKPVTWVRTCKDCHVLAGNPAYDALLDAGHKPGDRWRIAQKFEPVAAHWKNVTYTTASIADADRGKAVEVLTKLQKDEKPLITEKPDESPEIRTRVETKSVETKVDDRVKTPIREKPRDTKRAEPSKSDPMVATAADPVGGRIATTSAASTGASTIPAGASPLSLTPPPPINAAGLLAALHDRVAGLLESLLRTNAVLPRPLAVPTGPSRVQGADAELLRLQMEALALAVEALNLRANSRKSNQADPAKQ